MSTRDGQDAVELVDHYIENSIHLLGEDGFARQVRKKGSARLNDALLTMRSQKWFADIIQNALEGKQKVDTVLLNKIIDKAVATPAAQKQDEEEGFHLTIEQVCSVCGKKEGDGTGT